MHMSSKSCSLLRAADEHILAYCTTLPEFFSSFYGNLQDHSVLLTPIVLDRASKCTTAGTTFSIARPRRLKPAHPIASQAIYIQARPAIAQSARRIIAKRAKSFFFRKAWSIDGNYEYSHGNTDSYGKNFTLK